MKKIFALVMAFCFSCSSVGVQEDFDKTVQDDCEKALEIIPHENTYNKLVSSVETTTGTTLSYSVVGAAYTVDIAWKIGVGTVGFVVLCSPAILAAMASNYHTVGNHLACFPAPSNSAAIMDTKLVDKAKANTKNWHCPKVDEISQNIRKVAACYADKNKDKTKAIQILNSLKSQEGFFDCLSKKETANYYSDLTQYQ